MARNKLPKHQQLMALAQLKGLTRKDLAAKTGYSHAYISMIFNGDRPITREFAKKLAPLLGLAQKDCVGV